jgi:hypothetical protein
MMHTPWLAKMPGCLAAECVPAACPPAGSELMNTTRSCTGAIMAALGPSAALPAAPKKTTHSEMNLAVPGIMCYVFAK